VNNHDIAADKVVAVMLADGWHRVAPGSFVIGPLAFGPSADLGLPGFRFEEADAGGPYQPKMLAGPLNSIIAVRVLSPSRRRMSSPVRVWPTHNGHQAGHGMAQAVRTNQ
jgi:hypothetical protein